MWCPRCSRDLSISPFAGSLNQLGKYDAWQCVRCGGLVHQACEPDHERDCPQNPANQPEPCDRCGEDFEPEPCPSCEAEIHVGCSVPHGCVLPEPLTVGRWKRA